MEGDQLLCRIRVPGKAILCGEHAVVYGEDAIAMGLSLYCRGQVSTSHKAGTTSSITISSDINQENVVVDHRLLQIFEQVKEQDFKGQFKDFQNKVHQQIGGTVELSNYCVILHYKIALFLQMLKINWKQSAEDNPFDYSIKVYSNIPLGKGLGSSAAFNTLFALVLAVIFKQIKHCPLDPASKDLINEVSVMFERVEHGNPSGVDNFVSVHGGLILFNRAKEPKFRTLERASRRFKEAFTVAIADSQVPKNTRTAVMMVQERVASNEADRLKIKQIGAISTQILSILESDQPVDKGKVFSLLTKNHELLKQLGLSHSEIDRIVKLGVEMGWTPKITGSGMGGCVLLLAPAPFVQTCPQIQLASLDDEGLVVEFGSGW